MKLPVRNKTGHSTVSGDAKGQLHFRWLPAYAQYLLDVRLQEFIRAQLRLMVDMDFPMLRHTGLAALSEEELVELSAPAQTEFLRHAIDNRLTDYLEGTMHRWRADKLHVVSREDLAAEDISLSLFIRKCAMVRFLPEYTSDVNTVCGLIEEIDLYALEAEKRSFSTYLDIHQQEIRRMNRQLVRRTKQLLEAQQLANIGSFEWDLTGRGNPTFTPQVLRIFETENLTNPETLLLIVDEADREKVVQVARAAMRGKKEFDCEFRIHAGGREKTVWTRGVVELRGDEPRRIRGTVMDVSARRDMLSKLRRNEELYKQAEKLAHLGNWTYDLRTREVTWSDELYRLCDLTPQSKEVTVDFFMSLIHPEDQVVIRRLMRRLVYESQVDYRVRVSPAGSEIRFFLGKAELLRDISDRPYRIIGTCQDVSKEVQMTGELRKREENLAQLNRSLEQKNAELQRKNEELTSFNYVASHDLQEPLRKIKTFSDLALTRERGKLSETGVSWLERISAAAGRMQTLIQDLLAFSRTQLSDDSHRVVRLDEIIEAVCSTYEADIAQGKVVIERSRLPAVRGVPFQLHQLFENLISNSVKYHKDGVPAHIRISCGEAEVISSPVQPDSRYLKISVADNGIGFEQQYAGKIFEIFQRLHGQLSYSGTGIGLAICKKIAENHGGFIRASGHQGQGATFDVYFPQAMVVEEGDCSDD